ncbi:MAG: pyridoxal-dependent decarboxylase [Bacteriovoracaceae bacterium]|nr:pyridoxal-dependent decarboxylase [Bacteriovoracaceae bacterium]
MMSLEEFSKNAKIIIDWSVDFFKNLRSLPVKAKTNYGDLRLEIPLSPPQNSESFEDIWKDFCEKIIPKVNHWQHPKFFAYFPMNSSYPSILGDLAASIINTQAMGWELSPAATELEEIVLSWLQQEMRLPIHVRGVIHDTASTSTLCALMAARDRATDWKLLDTGWLEKNRPLILYCSAHAHSSVEKSHFMLGLGKDHIRKIPVDQNFSMISSELEKQIEIDLSNKCIPYAIVGAFGTTSTAAVDPMVELSRIALKYKIWLHVDAAYSGPTLLLKDFQEKYQIRNWDFDSLVLNPHKWMLTGFDCSILYVKNPLEYQKSFKVEPPYLKNLDVSKTKLDPDEMPTEYRHWTPALGRRFRALKLWFVMRSYGMEGIRKFLRSHLKMAKKFTEKMETLPEVKIVAPVDFALVCFRYQSSALSAIQLNEINQQWLMHINANGLYLSPTIIGSDYVLRFSIGSTHCEDRDIEESFEIIRKTLIKLLVTHGKNSP